MMESNTHISNPHKVLDHLETIRYKWVFLSEEDRITYTVVTQQLKNKYVGI